MKLYQNKIKLMALNDLFWDKMNQNNGPMTLHSWKMLTVNFSSCKLKLQVPKLKPVQCSLLLNQCSLQ